MKCNINGFEWELLECGNSEIPMNDGLFYGRTFYFDKKIYINKDADEKSKKQALRHELTHAFISETQISNQEKDYTYTEEMLCEFVAKYGEAIEKITNNYFMEK